jgi:serine/threonine protein kinase
MEYCNGGNLEKFMDKHKNVISEDKIKDFLAQFCAGYKILL